MTVNVRPLNIGLFRMMSQMVHSMDMMQNNFGMSESDLDELKEMFTGQDWRYLALTFGVSILHSWFAFLAFKNDIGFWKQKSNLEGLSVRTQWTSFVCQLIIFANLHGPRAVVVDHRRRDGRVRVHRGVEGDQVPGAGRGVPPAPRRRSQGVR
jgi:hypothetical protein